MSLSEKWSSFTNSDNSWLNLIRENQLDFIDDLAILLSQIKNQFDVRFYISKHRSIYIYVCGNNKYLHICRISDHHNLESHNGVMLDLVLEGGFASLCENSEALKKLEKSLAKTRRLFTQK